MWSATRRAMMKALPATCGAYHTPSREPVKVPPTGCPTNRSLRRARCRPETDSDRERPIAIGTRPGSRRGCGRPGKFQSRRRPCQRGRPKPPSRAAQGARSVAATEAHARAHHHERRLIDPAVVLGELGRGIHLGRDGVSQTRVIGAAFNDDGGGMQSVHWSSQYGHAAFAAAISVLEITWAALMQLLNTTQQSASRPRAKQKSKWKPMQSLIQVSLSPLPPPH